MYARPSGKIGSGRNSTFGDIKSSFIMASVYRFQHGCQAVLYFFLLSVNAEDIKAAYKDGLLEVEIPKPTDSKPKQVTVH